jgi:hypothetical protein
MVMVLCLLAGGKPKIKNSDNGFGLSLFDAKLPLKFSPEEPGITFHFL